MFINHWFYTIVTPVAVLTNLSHTDYLPIGDNKRVVKWNSMHDAFTYQFNGKLVFVI